MPAHKKNHSTPEPKTASVKVSPEDLPGEGACHQHLRELIQGATRVVMEEIMQEELSVFFISR